MERSAGKRYIDALRIQIFTTQMHNRENVPGKWDVILNKVEEIDLKSLIQYLLLLNQKMLK
jgi:hypothetical protein